MEWVSSDAKTLREIIDDEMHEHVDDDRPNGVRAMNMRDAIRFQVRVYKLLCALKYGFARELESLNVWSGTRGLRAIRALLVDQMNEIDRMLAEEVKDDGRQL
jgi:hypothetical protein